MGQIESTGDRPEVQFYAWMRNIEQRIQVLESKRPPTAPAFPQRAQVPEGKHSTAVTPSPSPSPAFAPSGVVVTPQGGDRRVRFLVIGEGGTIVRADVGDAQLAAVFGRSPQGTFLGLVPGAYERSLLLGPEPGAFGRSTPLEDVDHRGESRLLSTAGVGDVRTHVSDHFSAACATIGKGVRVCMLERRLTGGNPTKDLWRLLMQLRNPHLVVGYLSQEMNDAMASSGYRVRPLDGDLGVYYHTRGDFTVPRVAALAGGETAWSVSVPEEYYKGDASPSERGERPTTTPFALYSVKIEGRDTTKEKVVEVDAYGGIRLRLPPTALPNAWVAVEWIAHEATTYNAQPWPRKGYVVQRPDQHLATVGGTTMAVVAVRTAWRRTKAFVVLEESSADDGDGVTRCVMYFDDLMNHSGESHGTGPMSAVASTAEFVKIADGTLTDVFEHWEADPTMCGGMIRPRNAFAARSAEASGESSVPKRGTRPECSSCTGRDVTRLIFFVSLCPTPTARGTLHAARDDGNAPVWAITTTAGARGPGPTTRERRRRRRRRRPRQ